MLYFINRKRKLMLYFSKQVYTHCAAAAVYYLPWNHSVSQFFQPVKINCFTDFFGEGGMLFVISHLNNKFKQISCLIILITGYHILRETNSVQFM